jgi:hypothetical protein
VIGYFVIDSFILFEDKDGDRRPGWKNKNHFNLQRGI